ncbi:hypothetical protein CERSUDRAFT_109964 [Gelatoporia subvermispora B]|uniref:Uncharacterized protein n=1 Tax=Ceriporiopsis subvermispora (strain B) TaxID=914234 RepID=M2RR49_CERS8|nr:hypothetical protein CERSUDRAFT_109964 [Gelatoporia subvermispora B]
MPKPMVESAACPAYVDISSSEDDHGIYNTILPKCYLTDASYVRSGLTCYGHCHIVSMPNIRDQSCHLNALLNIGRAIYLVTPRGTSAHTTSMLWKLLDYLRDRREPRACIVHAQKSDHHSSRSLLDSTRCLPGSSYPRAETTLWAHSLLLTAWTNNIQIDAHILTPPFYHFKQVCHSVRPAERRGTHFGYTDCVVLFGV